MKTSRRSAVAPVADRDLDGIRAAVKANAASGAYSYDGLSGSEIAAYNRFLMFGANDEAFPSQEEWSRVVN